MRQHRRFKSINFILWVSFLAFAAFILILTWVFQITLLRTFLTVQVKDELESFGREIYQTLERMSPQSSQVIDGYILSKENDNRATDIFILNLEDGGKLHPSSEDGQLVTGRRFRSVRKGQGKTGGQSLWGQRHRPDFRLLLRLCRQNGDDDGGIARSDGRLSVYQLFHRSRG